MSRLSLFGVTPGAAYLRLKQRYRHGLRTAYYRDCVRPRILSSAPVGGTVDPHCEIHALTSARDWINLVWALKSFYEVVDRRYALCVHDDGSLGRKELAALRHHFPQGRVINRETADRRLETELSRFPRSAGFRRANPLALKVLDFSVFLQSERMLLLDSDVLFFGRPVRLIERVEDDSYKLNTLNRDWRYGYSIDSKRVENRLASELPERINSGLGLIHRGSIPVDRVEEFLGLPGINSHHHRVEQTLIALCSAHYGFEFLPSEYDVTVDEDTEAGACRHYTGPIRHLMYRDGLRILSRLPWAKADQGAVRT